MISAERGETILAIGSVTHQDNQKINTTRCSVFADNGTIRWKKIYAKRAAQENGLTRATVIRFLHEHILEICINIRERVRQRYRV